MPLYTKVSGTYKAASAAYVKVSGTWKAISTMYTKVGGAWKAGFAPDFTVSLDTTTVSGECSDPSFCTATTSVAEATPVGGGVAPFSYLWEYVSGDPGVQPQDSTAAAVSFELGGFTPGGTDAVYRCRVTDAAGTVRYSGDLSVVLAFNT